MHDLLRDQSLASVPKNGSYVSTDEAPFRFSIF